MLPIAYDRQQASAVPETPDVTKIMILSGLFGLMETGFTLLWAYVADQTGFFQSDFRISECSQQSQAGVSTTLKGLETDYAIDSCGFNASKFIR